AVHSPEFLDRVSRLAGGQLRHSPRHTEDAGMARRQPATRRSTSHHRFWHLHCRARRGRAVPRSHPPAASPFLGFASLLRLLFVLFAAANRAEFLLDGPLSLRGAKSVGCRVACERYIRLAALAQPSAGAAYSGRRLRHVLVVRTR